MNLRLGQFLFLLCLFLVLAISLAECYIGLQSWFGYAWLAAVSVNSILAILAYWAFQRGYLDHALLTEIRPSMRRWAYSPAAVIVGGTVLLAGISRWFGSGPPVPAIPSWDQWAWVLWVPIAEELVFRVGVGGLFRKVGGLMWGSYFSVALFSFLHSLPTLERVLAGDVGLTVGTFLLAAGCEVIWLFTRRIGAIIAFHAACNFTVIGFMLMDQRWLDWLSPLYL